MTRLIDADALMRDIARYHLSDGKFQHWVEVQPTVDAVPVRHGKWITKSTGGEFFDCCSECGYVEWDAPNKYCPHCGSRMDEE